MPAAFSTREGRGESSKLLNYCASYFLDSRLRGSDDDFFNTL
jgi:hypothetical protein